MPLRTGTGVLLDLVYTSSTDGRVNHEVFDSQLAALSRASDGPGTLFSERLWMWMLANARVADSQGDHAFLGICVLWIKNGKTFEQHWGDWELTNLPVSRVPESIVEEMRRLAPRP